MMKRIRSSQNGTSSPIQEKKWKDIGFQPTYCQETTTITSVNKKKHQKFGKDKVNLSSFLSSIYQINRHEEELRDSEVVSIENICQHQEMRESQIQFQGIRDETHLDAKDCQCKQDLQKMKLEIEKFRHFQRDAQNRTNKINLLIELYMQNDENPETIKDTIKKMNQEIGESEKAQEDWSLREENNEFKKKIEKMQQNLVKVLQKNSELENRVQHCEYKINELQGSLIQLRKEKITFKKQKTKREDLRKSHSIESERTNKTISKKEKLMNRVSPKSSSTKRFMRTCKRQMEDYITMRDCKNRAKLEKVTFLGIEQKRS